MKYEELYEKFMELLPQEKAVLHALEIESDVDSSDGMHIVFGMVIVPFVKMLFKNNRKAELMTVFGYFEKMAKTKDTRICEVLEFTVLEDFISCGQVFLNQCKKYMGPETLESCEAVEQYLIQ